MNDRPSEKRIDEHDWHSREYVDDWIARDVTRDSVRRSTLQQMIALAPFPRDASITVLDIGAGYGVVSEEVLKRFPHVRLTLQDYSAPMVEHARRRLGAFAEITYVMADLGDPGWDTKIKGPFDLVVSGLAIHNLRKEALMRACYGAIHRLLKPDGVFLDYDLFGLIEGGVNTHREWMRKAGFAKTECTWEDAPVGVIAAWMKSE